MQQKYKELLIRDLSARLQYNVVIHTDFGDYKMIGLIDDRLITDCEEEGRHNDFPIDICKPYLRPMSSMTQEEKTKLLKVIVGKDGVKYFQVLSDGRIDGRDAKVQDLNNLNIYSVDFNKDTTTSYLDWLNKKGFDYRGLIPKGLAIEAPVEMY